YFDIGIIFPGNLTWKGWYSLLENSSFREHLKQVNFFVASNHGQQNGYCPDIFDYFQPELVIISNKFNQPIQPEIESKYISHAKGLKIFGGNQKLLTTRDDGTITISKPPGKQLQITTSKRILIKDSFQNSNSLSRDL
ncbi:hypothetical protein CEN48_10735, partial [Fischerella thermalis CCMEE 5282]